MNRSAWTDAEIHSLTSLYPDTPTKDIAERLGRTTQQIYSKAASLGLKKSAAYLSGPHACRLLRGDSVGASTRFKPGLTPWNKGQPHPSRGRSAETQFKKGEMSGAAQHSGIGQVIIASAKVEVDYIRANNGGETPFLEAVGNNNLPPGVTGITRHRLAG